MATQEKATDGDRKRHGFVEAADSFVFRTAAVVVLVSVSFAALSETACFRVLVSEPETFLVVGTVALTALVPAFVVSFYVLTSNPDTVPATVLVGGFFLGACVTAVAGTVNGFVVGWFGALPYLLPLLFHVFVGTVEEFLKLVAVYLHPGKARLDTPRKYAAVGAFVGLGFGFSESFFYVVTNVVFGWETFLEAGMGLAAVSPLHVITTAVAGYYLGKARLNAGRSLRVVSKGLVVVSSLHATYNTTVTVSEGGGVTGVVAVVFFVALVCLLERTINGEHVEAA